MYYNVFSLVIITSMLATLLLSCMMQYYSIKSLAHSLTHTLIVISCVFSSPGLPKLHAEWQRAGEGAIKQSTVSQTVLDRQGPHGDPMATVVQEAAQSSK